MEVCSKGGKIIYACIKWCAMLVKAFHITNIIYFPCVLIVFLNNPGPKVANIASQAEMLSLLDQYHWMTGISFYAMFFAMIYTCLKDAEEQKTKELEIEMLKKKRKR